MRSYIKWGLLALCTIILIFLLSNINYIFLYHDPERLQVELSKNTDKEITVKEVADQLPGSAVVNEAEGILSVPYGKVGEYNNKARMIPGVEWVFEVMLDHQVISFRHYLFNVKAQLENYMHGDFGTIITRSGHGVIPVSDAMKEMIPRTFRYLILGLLFAVCLAVILSLIASLWRWTGKLLDGVHAMLVGLPDFLLIIFLQFAAIYAFKLTRTRLLLVYQFGDQVPFVIPFLTIALVPGVLIYGTMRLALQRELNRDYVITARAKGLSKWQVLFSHVFRNVVEDLLSVMPKATTIALASMAIAEAVCDILGLGGIIVSPRMHGIQALPASCLLLAVISMLFHALYAFLRKRFVVRTREAG